MWSREGLKSSASIYSSTPHLFVYQPCDDEDLDTEPSDSGYADSTRSCGAASGRSCTPEPIYFCPTDLEANRHTKEKEAILRLSQKYTSYNQTPNVMDSPSQYSDCITDIELLRIETFFRGHQTQVFVCKSLANLYFRTAKSLVGLNRYSSQPDVCIRTSQKQEDRVSNWELKHTGIPVVLLDTGSTRSRDRRRIQLILAERGTGFTLWKDIIDNLSNYEAPETHFHTMRLSTDHRQIAGLSFDDSEAAQQLFNYMEMLTSNPANICLSKPKTCKSTKLFRFWAGTNPNHKPKANKKPPRKTDISQPCFFQHVTSVDLADRSRFFSLQALVPTHK